MKITQNKTARTFTIYVIGAKYRTVKLTAQEFHEMEFNTAADWKAFLNSSNNYYKVK